MITRILMGLAYAGIGALAVGWWHNRTAIDDQRQAQIQSFMQKGARFTSQDGQDLCLRIQRLEAVSYGYHDRGGSPLPCEYYREPR